MAIVLVVLGVAMVAAGVMMRKYQLLKLLGGYDPNKVADKQGLANWLGANMILMGLLIIVAGVLKMAVYVSIVLLGVILAISIRTVLGAGRYEKGS